MGAGCQGTLVGTGRFQRASDPVNEVVRQYYGPGSALPQNDGMRTDAFSSPSRYPASVKEKLQDHRDERVKMDVLQQAVDISRRNGK